MIFHALLLVCAMLLGLYLVCSITALFFLIIGEVYVDSLRMMLLHG